MYIGLYAHRPLFEHDTLGWVSNDVTGEAGVVGGWGRKTDQHVFSSCLPIMSTDQQHTLFIPAFYTFSTLFGETKLY